MTSAIEAWIDQFNGATWSFEEHLPFEQINDAKSRDNQARTTALDDSTVTRYKLAAGAGAVFPPLIVHQHGTKYVIIDGNHRHHGLMGAGLKGHPAYIVSAPSAVLAMMTDNANAMNGVPPSDDEVRTKIISLAATTNLTQAQIAVVVGRSEGQVTNVIQAADARKRAKSQRAAMKLSDSMVRVIGRCASDDALDVLIDIMSGPKPLRQHDLNRVVTLSNKQRSDADRVQVILDEAALAQATNGKLSTGKKSDARKLSLALGTIRNLNPASVALEAASPHDLASQVEDAIDALGKIKAAL